MSSTTVSVTPGTGSSTTTSSSSVIKTTKKQQQKRIVSNENDENDESVPITNDFLNNDDEENNEDVHNEHDSSSEANNITSTNKIPITINNTQLILNLNDNEIDQVDRADEKYDDGNYDEGGGEIQTLSNRTHKFLESSDDQLIKQIFSQTITSAGVTPTDDDDEDTQKAAPFILGIHKLGADDSTLKMQQHPSIVIDCYDDDEAGIEYNLDDPVGTDDMDVYHDNFTIQNHYFDQTIVDEDDVDLDEDVPVVNVQENFDQNVAIAGIDLITEEDHNVSNEEKTEIEDLSESTKLEEGVPNIEQNEEATAATIIVEHDTEKAVESLEDEVIALVDNTWKNENETAANANTNNINIDNDNTNIDSVS